eukprot:scaffold20780_cov101-Isochrysis_galbana.AAC.1
MRTRPGGQATRHVQRQRQRRLVRGSPPTRLCVCEREFNNDPCAARSTCEIARSPHTSPRPSAIRGAAAAATFQFHRGAPSISAGSQKDPLTASRSVVVEAAVLAPVQLAVRGGAGGRLNVVGHPAG